MAGAALVIAAVLAVGGTFASLSDYVLVFHGLPPGRVPPVFSTTSWLTQYPVAGQQTLTTGTHDNYMGVPVVIAAALLLYAASVVLRGQPVVGRARILAAAAVGAVAGYVWLSVAATINNTAQLPPGAFFEFRLGTGVWVLIAAALVGALGAVLMIGLTLPPQLDEPELLVYEMEMDTPPLGFPVPVELPSTEP